ncbi:hypothetical protein HZA57_08930 [Candidatus Poribacteria bacterium]|nr:hypothetical protein [Candidatus Poribacteria bacterium]
MTAEIVVMNRGAIALAADSAVTVSVGRGQKVFNSANKLFALSKFEPVGIMVYGSAQLLHLPWETVIKDFREQLWDRPLPLLPDYGRAFIEYLGALAGPVVDAKPQERFVESEAESLFRAILRELEDWLSGRFAAGSGQQPTVAAGVAYLRELIGVRLGYLESESWCNGFGEHDPGLLLARYGMVLSHVLDSIWSPEVIAPLREEFLRLAVLRILKGGREGHLSGVVVAGFGSKDLFPGLVSYNIHGYVLDRLLFSPAEEVQTAAGRGVYIAPYAQTDMVRAFATGIHPVYAENLHMFAGSLFDSIPELIQTTFGIRPGDHATQFEALRLALKSGQHSFESELARLSRERFMERLEATISGMPKDELASLAESLLSLSVLEQKTAFAQETVGGPIDVAVISRGDGFVWSRRKHYFATELNPHFGANYFRRRKESHGTAET